MAWIWVWRRAIRMPLGFLARAMEVWRRGSHPVGP